MRPLWTGGGVRPLWTGGEVWPLWTGGEVWPLWTGGGMRPLWSRTWPYGRLFECKYHNFCEAVCNLIEFSQQVFECSLRIYFILA